MGAMWEAYAAASRTAEEAWTENDCPVEIAAVAAATGLEPRKLWDEVEGVRGWESHDQGYQGMVWLIAWGMRGYPDWQGAQEAAGGDQQVGGT